MICFCQWQTHVFQGSGGRQRKMKHWFTDHTLRLIRQKRRVYRSLLLSPNDHLHNKYSKLSNLVRASTRKDTQDYICSSHFRIIFYCTKGLLEFCESGQSFSLPFTRY